MTRDERAAIEWILEKVPAAVESWSDGLAVLEPFDLVAVRRPVTSLSSSGGGRWWVGPREVRTELAEVADTGARYDSVYAMWPGDPSVPQCGWGCSLGPSDATFGAGFSSISTDHWVTIRSDPDPDQGYVHEWHQQVESLYRALGVSEAELPPLHDAAQFTSTRSTEEPPYGRTYAEYHDSGALTWSPWYRDWMTGRLRRVAAEGAAEADSGASQAGPGEGGASEGDAGGDAGGVPVQFIDHPANAETPSLIGLTRERWALRQR